MNLKFTETMCTDEQPATRVGMYINETIYGDDMDPFHTPSRRLRTHKFRGRKSPLKSFPSQEFTSTITPLEEGEELLEEKKGSIAGLLLMFMSNIFSTIVGYILKQLYFSTDISPYQFLYLKGTITLLFNVLYAHIMKINVFNVDKMLILPVMGYAVCRSLSLLFGFISLLYIDFSVFTVILYSSPIYTTILGYLFLSEILSKYDIFGVISGFIGISLIVLWGNMGESSSYWPYAYGIIAALFHSLSFICVRTIKIMKEGGINIIILSFYYSLLTSLLGSFQLVYAPHNGIYTFSIYSLWVMLLAAIAGWGNQLTFMKAVQIEKAGRAAAIKYSQVLFAYIVDIFIFKQPIYLKDIFGVIFIVGSNFTIVILKVLLIIT